MLRVEPVTFSAAFGVHSSAIRKAGAVDIALNCDTKLFIDPLLLRESSFAGFRDCAARAYRERFELVIKLLAASEKVDDKAWRAARQQLQFPENSYIHLGYSSGRSGSGFGTLLTDSLIASAKQVIDLGVKDPDIFVALALFEEGVGADRISDMTSHIILDCLIAFTQSVTDHLGLPTRSFTLREVPGRQVRLPANSVDGGKPIVLVPADIVRDLPVASDWESVAAAARETQDLRDRVNADIGDIWAARTKKQKSEIRKRLVSSRTAIEIFLDLIRSAADEPYDIKADHNGELYPADLRRSIADKFPLDLQWLGKKSLTAAQAQQAVASIIEHFAKLIEDNGLWSLLWNEQLDKPRREKASQQLFFAVANAYCDANGLDLTPEANAGSGPVDFKFSRGRELRIIVEAKKSTNPDVVKGYSNQLEIYKAGEATPHAHYVVIDFGDLTSKKRLALTAARDAASKTAKGASKLWFVDASRKESASKRKKK